MKVITDVDCEECDGTGNTDVGDLCEWCDGVGYLPAVVDKPTEVEHG